MNYVAVESSSLKAVGYDGASSTLGIQFRNGGEYEYYGVPSNVYTGILDADSAGKYFHAHVRNAGYRFRQLR